MSPNEQQDTEEVKPAVVEATVVEDVPCPEGFTVVTVTQKNKETCVTFTANLAYNFGTDLESMTTLFGAETVFTHALAGMKVRAQAVARPSIGKGISAEADLAAWTPGVKRAAVVRDPEKDAKAYIKTLSREALAEMMAEMDS